jgi:hypothetical protein
MDGGDVIAAQRIIFRGSKCCKSALSNITFGRRVTANNPTGSVDPWISSTLSAIFIRWCISHARPPFPRGSYGCNSKHRSMLPIAFSGVTCPFCGWQEAETFPQKLRYVVFLVPPADKQLLDPRSSQSPLSGSHWEPVRKPPWSC